MSLRRFQRGIRQMGGFAGGTSHLARPPAVLPEPDIRPHHRGVIGIAFVTADTKSGPTTGADQVFPSADGIVEFWRAVGGNWFATPKAGEARFSEFEFLSTALADGNPLVGRGTLEEMTDPVIYIQRVNGTSGTVWSFDPVAGTHVAATASYANVNQGFDAVVRDYSDEGFLLFFNGSTSRYNIRKWTRANEGTPATTAGWWTFPASGQQPENVDIDPGATPFGFGHVLWVSGDDGAGAPYVSRLDDNEPTWSFPTISGYSWDYVDTIQCVGEGEALGLSLNLSSTGFDDALTFWRFTVGESEAFDLSDGVTVDGDPYRTWAAAAGDNIKVQSNVKMAVLGERVAALTGDGTILLGTLIRG